MRHFVRLTATIVSITFINILPQHSARASNSLTCVDRCFFHVQYPDYNNMTPDQQYQERQREYREQQNDEYYKRERQQMDLQQQLERRRPSSYGAIAYSAETGDYGYSDRFANRAQAEQRARQECGKSDCEIATWYFDSCGALAADDDGNWGGAQGSDEQRAIEGARAQCAKEGGQNCKVIVSRCSR
jgi:Domain of unknown function (DUF4189)